VAKVSAAGVVTGVKAGTAVITVKTAEGARTAACRVTVGPPVVGVTLNRATAPLHIGKTLTLTVTVAPANAANRAVTWSSSNAAVAKVSAAGVVTGVKAGTAVITVKTAEGAKTAACRVTVAQGKAAYTVTYDANGGLDAPAPQAAEHEKNIILSDAKPTRMGYSFVKWNTNQSGTGANYPSGAPYTSGETVTLYAVWKQNNTYKATLAPKFKPSKEFVSNAFGTVHAIAQSKGMASKPHPYWDANHWPTAFAGGAPAGCVLSCHCMALSSLGVPVIPKMLLEADENKNEAMVRTSDCYINSYAKVAKFAGKQAGKAIACKTVVSRAGDFNTAFASRDSNWAALNQSLANYLAQPSKYSPPIVRIFMPGNADSHSIIFIGMEADGTYRVIDPGYRCRRAVIKAPASDEISANSTAYTTIVSGIQQYVIVNRTETT